MIDYPILERIHYLLVAGFDVFGAMGRQLTTRLCMDFLRLEGEFNFLALLPPETRRSESKRWNEGASAKHQSYLFGSRADFEQPSGIDYTSDNPKHELFAMLQDRLAPVLSRRYDLDAAQIPATHLKSLKRIATLKGQTVSFLPEVVFLNVRSKSGKDYYYTLLRNTAHTNVSTLFGEDKRLKPEENDITVVPGFIGSYPDAFWVVEEYALPVLAHRLAGLFDESRYRALVDRFGVRRTSPNFWQHSDKVIKAHYEANPLENGLLDYSRIENR